MEFLSFIDLFHSFIYRQIDRQILPAPIVLKYYILEKAICEKWNFYKYLVCGIKKLICDSQIMNL